MKIHTDINEHEALAHLTERFQWLLAELDKCKRRFESKITDANEIIVTEPESRFPAVTQAKAKTRSKCYNEMVDQFRWLLGEARPWMKAYKHGGPEAAPKAKYCPIHRCWTAKPVCPVCDENKDEAVTTTTDWLKTKAFWGPTGHPALKGDTGWADPEA